MPSEVYESSSNRLPAPPSSSKRLSRRLQSPVRAPEGRHSRDLEIPQSLRRAASDATAAVAAAEEATREEMREEMRRGAAGEVAVTEAVAEAEERMAAEAEGELEAARRDHEERRCRRSCRRFAIGADATTQRTMAVLSTMARIMMTTTTTMTMTRAGAEEG